MPTRMGRGLPRLARPIHVVRVWTFVGSTRADYAIPISLWMSFPWTMGASVLRHIPHAARRVFARCPARARAYVLERTISGRAGRPAACAQPRSPNLSRAAPASGREAAALWSRGRRLGARAGLVATYYYFLLPTSYFLLPTFLLSYLLPPTSYVWGWSGGSLRVVVVRSYLP